MGGEDFWWMGMDVGCGGGRGVRAAVFDVIMVVYSVHDYNESRDCNAYQGVEMAQECE